MGEQGHYRPPRWQAQSGSVSFDALETAFGAAPADPGRGGPPGPGPDRPQPSWPAVVVTTVRLWLRRRGAALGRLFRHRWVIAAAVLAAAALVVTGLIASAPRHAGAAPAAAQQPARPGPLTGSLGGGAGPGTAGHAAAVWVAHQVSRDAVVGCDPGMCRLLQAQGLPASGLLVLRPGGAGLRLCDVIVATQAARHLVGGRLQREYAPAVIAGFGSGAARVDVRAVAPGGAAAYRAALAADWAARRKAAAQLVASPRIHAGGAARQELLAGQVDSRLLITLAALSVSYPVEVVAFGDSAPGAAAGLPLRAMEVAPAGRPASRPAGLRRLRSLVLAQHAVFLPAHVSRVRLAGGGVGLRIEFGVPGPLGLLLGRPVTQ